MGINHWQVSYRENGRRKYLHFSTLKRALYEIKMLYMDMIETDNLPVGSSSINIMLKTKEDTPPKKIDGIPYAEFMKGGE